MFEKIKAKAVLAKNWVVEHKSEIIVGALAATAGAVGVVVIDNVTRDSRSNKNLDDYMNKCKPGENLLVDLLKIERSSGGIGYITDNADGTTIESLSDRLAEMGAKKDGVITGALVYTKGDIV